jgi:hypothetical protein
VSNTNTIANLTQALMQINTMLPVLMALGKTVAGAITKDGTAPADAKQAVNQFREAAQKVRSEGQEWLDTHPADL